MLHESSAGITALESRLKELVRQDPVYDRYLRHINDFDEPGRGGPGVVIYAVLLGEAGSARSLWCFDHVKANVVAPQLRDRCSHSKQEVFDERLLISSPSERRLGVASFPSSPHMAQFFGVGLQESGGMYQNGDALHDWNVRTFATKGQKRCNDPVRKTFVCEHLPMSFNWMSAEAKKDHPWARLLLEEQTAKRAYWARVFDTTPPPRCTACMRSGCKKCENFSGKWELPEDREASLWVCRCHDSGYYFASHEHLRRHAYGKLGRRFLDLLYHAALFIEGHVFKPPTSELALKYLDGGKYLRA